ncbi:MAG: ABC transporter ATP-binding protein, partial [Propionibacteriaceae bacterium]
MSTSSTPSTTPAPAKAPERPAYAAQAGRSGGPFGGARVAEKSLNFLPSLKRLLGELRPERGVLLGAVALTVVGIGMSVLGPRILG